MEIKSVNNSQQPNYPTIELFVKHPELLSRNIPSSWLKNQFVMTSLAAFLLSSCGTNSAQKSEDVVVVDSLGIDNPQGTIQNKKTDNNIVTNVAPVFAHGEGRGATGCVVISPPVFLSEDEAIKIILDKLRAEGYNFSRKNCPEIKFTAPPIANDCYGDRFFDDDTTKVVSDAKVELKMDGYNKDLNLAIQFVSREDFSKFTSDDGCSSSVQGYDTKKAAEIIREKLILDGKTKAGVFYDPITRVERGDWEKYDERRELAKKEAKDLLLAQVNDFINWLKSNNITIE